MSPTGQAATVLVVDDEPSVGQLFQEVLPQEGYRVLVARTGSECLELAAVHRPDLLLLDLMLDGMDGLAILRSLRSREKGPVVIVLTAYGSLESAREAMALGVYEYLTKPFSLERLKTVLREGLAMAVQGPVGGGG